VLQWLMWTMVASMAGEGFDHDYLEFQRFLSGAVSDSGVDYDTLAGRRAQLDAHLLSVSKADVSTFTKPQQLAFYVNAYNGYTLATILDARPLKSIRELDGGDVWKVRRFAVAGQQLTLNDLEHERARKLTDGRVHAVVNCASKGCPPLPQAPLRAEGLEATLDEAAARWVRSNAYTLDGDDLVLSKIFSWYAVDFTPWAGKDLPSADDAQDAAIGFLQAFSAPASLAEARTVAWGDYDWTLNTQAP
jgi:hypothetical protein